jgi:vacuolar-type H+-ATPase subunit F/Vma7
MTIVVLADEADARGFRLAGIDALLCESRTDVEDAVAALGGGPADDRPAVLFVSAPVAALAPDVVEALQDDDRWTAVLVLPASEGN